MTAYLTGAAKEKQASRADEAVPVEQNAQKNSHVGNVAHCPMSQEDENEDSISKHADNKYNGE